MTYFIFRCDILYQNTLYIYTLETMCFISLSLSNSYKNLLLCWNKISFSAKIHFSKAFIKSAASSPPTGRADLWQVFTHWAQLWSSNLKLNLKNCGICLSWLIPVEYPFYPAGICYNQQKLISLSLNNIQTRFFME